MGSDDRPTSGGVVVVPMELVASLITTALDTMEQWHHENEQEVDLLVCCGALAAMSRILAERFMGGEPGSETIQ